jgi:hypothetical protein
MIIVLWNSFLNILNVTSDNLQILTNVKINLLFYNHIRQLQANTVFIVINPHRVTGVSLPATLRRGCK